MVKYQGMNKLLKGYKKHLTASEKARGYIFVTTALSARETINNGVILINNEEFECTSRKKQSIDKYGRLIVGMRNIKIFGNSEMSFVLKDGKLLISSKK